MFLEDCQTVFFLAMWIGTISVCFSVFVADMGGYPPLCLKGKFCMMLADTDGFSFFFCNSKDGYKMSLHFTVISHFN